MLDYDQAYEEATKCISDLESVEEELKQVLKRTKNTDQQCRIQTAINNITGAVEVLMSLND